MKTPHVVCAALLLPALAAGAYQLGRREGAPSHRASAFKLAPPRHHALARLARARFVRPPSGAGASQLPAADARGRAVAS